MDTVTVDLRLGDCLDVLPTLDLSGVDGVIMDPPYGIDYKSGMTGHDGGTALPGIEGDQDTALRDEVLKWVRGLSVICFGSWKRAKPDNCAAVLTWDKGDHVGMGNLSMPWKPNTEEIYIIGSGFSGHRGSSVLSYNAPVTWNSKNSGRTHPHEKPVALMMELISKTVGDTILDPFMGSGSTGVACAKLGRHFIGIEKDPAYFAIAQRRIADAQAQPALFQVSP